jgi:hypothetical protein
MGAQLLPEPQMANTSQKYILHNAPVINIEITSATPLSMIWVVKYVFQQVAQ